MQAKNILVATGSYPIKAPIEGSEHGITSDEVLNLEKLPEKCVLFQLAPRHAIVPCCDMSPVPSVSTEPGMPKRYVHQTRALPLQAGDCGGRLHRV